MPSQGQIVEKGKTTPVLKSDHGLYLKELEMLG